MTRFCQRRIAVVAMGAAAVALAAPVQAEVLEGSYTATVTATMGGYNGAKTVTWNFKPCGPDCAHLNNLSSEFRNIDGKWTGTFDIKDQTGEVVVCNRTVDSVGLTATDVCPQPASILVNYQLTKN